MYTAENLAPVNKLCLDVHSLQIADFMQNILHAQNFYVLIFNLEIAFGIIDLLQFLF